MAGTRFLAAAAAAETPFAGGGFSWWQTLGGLLVVFGLLLLCLKLLGRLNRRRTAGEARILTVWPLGPRREIQVLRLGDEVHYIYRHESAMVRLKEESFAAWQASRGSAPAADQPQGLQRLLSGVLRSSPRALTPTGPGPDLTSF